MCSKEAYAIHFFCTGNSRKAKYKIMLEERSVKLYYIYILIVEEKKGGNGSNDGAVRKLSRCPLLKIGNVFRVCPLRITVRMIARAALYGCGIILLQILAALDWPHVE